jgi:hypothetical protein
MEKASGGSFARTTRKTAEDEGRRRGRGRLGHDAIHILVPGYSQPVPPGQEPANREFTTIRGKKRQKGKVKLTLLKPVFVDFQGSNFRFQSRGRNAELGCGTR